MNDKNLKLSEAEIKELSVPYPSENTAEISQWIPFKIIPRGRHNFQAPYDGKPFLALIWGNDTAGQWVGMGIYARHYDASDGRIPMKYEFFYVTSNPEEEGWRIGIEDNPFPITHWMPLPNLPEIENESMDQCQR